MSIADQGYDPTQDVLDEEEETPKDETKPAKILTAAQIQQLIDNCP